MAGAEQTENRTHLMYPPFPEDAMREARALRLDGEIFRYRKLVQGITIDSAASSDLDDAIWVEKIG